MMEFRELTTSEREGIAHEFISRGVPPPDANAVVMGAFLESRLLGFQVIQFQLHAEPMCIYAPAATRGLFRATEERIKQSLGPGTRFFALAEGRVGELAAALGMVPRTETVYEKVT